MTLEQLKVMCAIVDHGGFRAASEALYKSQSAISIAIRKLEEELNVTLFQREQYRPKLTEEGEILYKKAKSILSHANEFTSLAQHFSMGEEPNLRLAMSGVVPVEHILNVLRDTSEYAPATQLSLQVENLNGTIERLKDGDADIAITEVFNNETGYSYQQLTQVKMVCIISKNSPLAKSSATLTERDIEGCTQILVRDTSQHMKKITAGVVEGSNHWVVNDFMMKKRIIASGMGWGRLPYHMVEQEIKDESLIILTSPDFPALTIDIQMVRRKNKPIGNVEKKLWNLLTERFAEKTLK
ncbi:MAG: LysR family transcriptional regulator [Mariprofundaceae bacterium]